MISINKRGNIINVKNTPEYRHFWELYASNVWEEETFNIFDRFTQENRDYLDIGAWIGPTALYAAHKAKRVFAFEPDPVAFRELVYNISVNSELALKITPFSSAVAPQTGTKKIAGRRGLGTSETSFLNTEASDDNFLEVHTICLNEFAESYPDLDICLIKMDIEGFEFELVPTLASFLKKYKPTIYISLHKQFLAEHILKEITAKYSYEAAQRAKQAGYIDRQVELFTWQLVESLSFYKNLYSVTGELTSALAIATKESGFIAANEIW